MWIKVLKSGKKIIEDRKVGDTWTKTPQVGIKEVFLYNNNKRSPPLKDCLEYWHSRTAVYDSRTGEINDIAERIQGLREDGQWDTIEFRGKGYVRYLADKAYGKPING